MYLSLFYNPYYEENFIMLIIDDYTILKESNKFLLKIDSIINNYNATRIKDRITISRKDFNMFLNDLVNEFSIILR